MTNTTTKHMYSPWSGKAYGKPQTADDLTRESKRVLQSNPAIARVVNLKAVDDFIKRYAAKVPVR